MRWLAITCLALAGCVSVPQRYQGQDIPQDILRMARQEAQAWEKLCFLCDRIGHRLSGSPRLDRAIEWAAETMKREGLSNVHKEKVMVPAWERGKAEAWIVEPGPHQVDLLALGGSIATPAGGMTAEVMVVNSFEALGPQCKGRIVVYNVPFKSYGETVRYRTRGASEASKHGAVASLVRSIGPVSLDTPHTGNQRYAEGVKKIPTAAITIEAAEIMQRLQDRGVTPKFHLELGCRQRPHVESANVIGEVPGRTDEVIVLAAHLDSWDVGQGAHDDGAGVVMVMEAARILAKLDLNLKRTVRVVLYTNEENGLAGGRAYRDAHEAELPKHVAAIESDSGGGRPLGVGVTMPDKKHQEAAMAKLREFVKPFKSIEADAVRERGGGADIGPLRPHGVPTMNLWTDTSRYFDIHHTRADTIDKVDPEQIARGAAVLATVAWRLSEMEGRLGD